MQNQNEELSAAYPYRYGRVFKLLAALEDAVFDTEGGASVQTISSLIACDNALTHAVARQVSQPRYKNTRKEALPANPVRVLTYGDTSRWIEELWTALHGYREGCIPEGVVEYDEQWDEICTAMAWITERLEEGVPPAPKFYQVDIIDWIRHPLSLVALSSFASWIGIVALFN